MALSFGFVDLEARFLPISGNKKKERKERKEEYLFWQLKVIQKVTSNSFAKC